MDAPRQSPSNPTVDYRDTQKGDSTRIDRFVIREILGAGAFGQVYRAYDGNLNRDVAIKVPVNAERWADADRSQFYSEARAAATINHPNVCQVYEVGEHRSLPYIVMALVPGESLAEMLENRKSPLSEKQVALIVRKIALALGAAHDKGIVHRDLKTANVMYDRERKDIVVMDFGLARGPALGDVSGTASGVIMGTPSYMSPEQARGNSKRVGPESDVFSLGVIMYELLTQCRPFTGTVTEVIGQILHVEPEKPSTHRQDLSKELENVCLKALAKDPSKRYASMQQLVADIDQYLGRSKTGSLSNPSGSQPSDSPNPPATKPPSTRGELADVFAILSEDRKLVHAETKAVVEAAIRNHSIPRRTFMVMGILALITFSGLASALIYLRPSDVSVKVTLAIEGVDFQDKSLAFFIDDQPISGEALEKPVELIPGEHVFVAKRGDEVVKRVIISVPKVGDDFQLSYRDDPVVSNRITWQPLIVSDADLIESRTNNAKIRQEGSAHFQNDQLTMTGRFDFVSNKFTAKNYILRGKIVHLDVHNFRCYIRQTATPGDRAGYSVQFYQIQPGIEVAACDLGKMRSLEARQPMPSTTKRVSDRYPFEFAFAAYENEISVFINGECVLRTKEDEFRISEGTVGISTWAGTPRVVLEKLEYCLLDGTSLSPDDVIKSPLEKEIQSLLSPDLLTEDLLKTDLLKNGNFEKGLENWRLELEANNPSNITVVESERRKSKKSVMFIGQSTKGFSHLIQTLPVRPNRWYLLSGWVKTTNLRFFGHEERGASLYVLGGYRLSSEKPTASNDWTYYAVIFNSANRQTVDVMASLGCKGGSVTGWSWFDDLHLVELPDSITTSAVFHSDR